MSGNGYVPLFGSLTTGTLCGKWPDIGLWPIVLSLADKNGMVDVTHQYIATVTGLALPEVIACMKRFCDPDYGSRSPAEAGARLLLLEEHREWGWQVVNHSLYRERARLMAQNSVQVADGRNAEKVRRYKERHRETPPDTRGHPETPADTLSNANANTVEEQHRKRGADTRRGSRIPDPFPISEDLREWAKRETPEVDLEKATAEFLDYWRGVTGQRGYKLDWPATWRNRMREVQGRIRKPGKPQEEPRRGLPVLRV